MAKANSRVTLPGSERTAPAGAKSAGAADPQGQLEITVRLRSRKAPLKPADIDAQGAEMPADRQYISRDAFADAYGADPADVAKIGAFAHAHDLTIVASSLAERTVKLGGSIADFNAAFGVKLKTFKKGAASFRGRTGGITIPAELKGIIVGVHGLDNRPVATPHFRQRAQGAGAQPRNASDGSLAVPDIAKLYNFPAGLSGTGQCIALIELNDQDQKGNITGTGFTAADIAAFFRKVNIPAPQVVSIGVDGGKNMPGFSAADGEVVLDIEVAGAAAPGATIAVYFAPNTTQGFIDAIKAAAHDNIHKPSIISISWGGPEDPSGQIPQQFIDGMNEAFQEAAAMGLTVCCASGDNGSPDMDKSGWDGKPHVDFPSSSPLVLACGGTKLTGTGTTIQSEVVWNEGQRGGAGGGGVSNIIPLPVWQTASKVPKNPKGKKGRGVPDVSGDADPATGYQVILNGKGAVFGGTSAVAPLMAALLARINQRLTARFGKTAGFINPLLYGAASSAFRDITSGNNDVFGTLKGKYTARRGWDACTGLGVADGSKLVTALGG
ncbi:MAG: S53 family peptidase [Terriglobia bacterium]